TVTSASGPSLSMTLALRLAAALLVNVSPRISSARAAPLVTRARMRSAITEVLPAPAPATRNSGATGWSMASCCSAVGVKAGGQVVHGQLEVVGHGGGGGLTLAGLVVDDPDAAPVVGPVDAVDGTPHHVRAHLDLERVLDGEDLGRQRALTLLRPPVVEHVEV